MCLTISVYECVLTKTKHVTQTNKNNTGRKTEQNYRTNHELCFTLWAATDANKRKTNIECFKLTVTIV